MEVSSTSIKAARATVVAISQGLTRGFQGALVAGAGLSMLLGAGSRPDGDAACNSDKNFLLQTMTFCSSWGTMLAWISWQCNGMPLKRLQYRHVVVDDDLSHGGSWILESRFRNL